MNYSLLISEDYEYFLLIFINVASTGVILSPNPEVGKVPHKARHGVDGHVLPGAEAAGQNNLMPVTNRAGVTWIMMNTKIV